MTISSRTPEGEPNRCPVCGNALRLEPSRPPGDAPCSFCGSLLWFQQFVLDRRLTAQDRVRVKQGTFAAMEGRVENIDYARGRVRLIITIFGRPVPVELEPDQVELAS